MNRNKNRFEKSRTHQQDETGITGDPELRELLYTLRTMVQGPDLSESFDAFIDLRIPVGFDLVFGEPVGIDFLVDIINAFLPTAVASVTTLTPVERSQRRIDGVLCNIFDFWYEDDLGRLIIIDLQKTFINNYQKQIISELDKVTEDWLRKQTENKKQTVAFPVIGLCIADFLVSGQPATNCIKVADENEDYLQAADLMKEKPLLLLAELKKMVAPAEALAGAKEMFLFLLSNIAREKEIPDIFNTNQFLPLFKLARLADRTIEEKQRYEQGVFDQVVLEEKLTITSNEFFKYGVRHSFLSEVKESGDKRGIQVYTCGRLYKYSHLMLDEIADVIDLSVDEVKEILKAEGINFQQ